MTRARRERRAEARRPSTDGEPWWRRRAPWVAAAIAFVVYLPSLGGGFLYDDQEVVVLNPSIRGLGDLRTVLMYQPSRPLLNLTWALNYAAGGLRPWPYHLVNVLLHAGNAALLASLFHWMAARRGRADASGVALAGAGLFAASPMAAETVAYVSSRSSALVALFTFASLHLAATALSDGPRWKLGPALALFGLAMASKEEAIALPLLLLLLDYFFIAGQRLADMRTRLLLHAPFLLLIPVAVVARRLMTGHWLPPPAVDPGVYLLTQWAALAEYFLRLVVPLDPALYRYHQPASWPPGAATIAWSLVTAALIAVAVRRRRAAPEWLFAMAALAAGLLPTWVVVLEEMVVDHRAYLGGFATAFALGGWLWRVGGLRLVAPILIVLAARAVHYQWVLADPVRAWSDAVRRAPGSADALCALGEAYAERRDPRAEASFKHAIRLEPRRARYWANLGVYYSEVGRIAEAVPALQAAVRESPNDGALRDYLGLLLDSLGRHDEAVRELEEAIRVEPDLAQPRINLARLLLRRGDRQRASALLEEAARRGVTPEQAEIIVELQGARP